MKLSVREAGSADVGAVLAVYVDSSNAGFGDRMPFIEASSDRLERWRVDLSDQTPTRWWLAVDDGEVLGFVGIGPGRDPEPQGWGELDAIAVTPTAWGVGVGTVLMQTALASLREAEYPAAYLWTLNDYPLGERFYLSRGWRKSEATRRAGSQVRYEFSF